MVVFLKILIAVDVEQNPNFHWDGETIAGFSFQAQLYPLALLLGFKQ